MVRRIARVLDRRTREYRDSKAPERRLSYLKTLEHLGVTEQEANLLELLRNKYELTDTELAEQDRIIAKLKHK